MPNLIVVNNPNDWPVHECALEVVAAKTYLTDARYSAQKSATRVFNLCKSYNYQSVGYYVSLLAHARGHKPLPSVAAMQDLKVLMARFVSEELEDLIQRTLAPVQGKRHVMDIFFGRNPKDPDCRLATKLFGLFEVPLLRAQFIHKGGKWILHNAGPLNVGDIPLVDRSHVLELAQQFSSKTAPKNKKKEYRYDLAILHNPAEKEAPSDAKALKRFQRAAENQGIRTELILKEDFPYLGEYDALFIRETTSVNHHTYRFARRAQAEGLVVIDDPDSILKCTNKVYLAELLERHAIPHPRTVVVNRENIKDVEAELGFPVILKQPDSSFSQGVRMAKSREEYLEIIRGLLERSELVLAQEFLPTDFDWRIGVLDRKPLYACRYFMAAKHWQIIKRDKAGKTTEGKYDCVPLEEVPKNVLRTCLRAANLIGDGLYGVDAKDANGRCYIIEVNDNPSIDAGVEDSLLGPALYDRVVAVMLARIEARKRGSTGR